METEIVLHGRLTKVNCEKRTAELHSFGDAPTVLQFEEHLGETMQQLAAPASSKWKALAITITMTNVK